MLWDAAKSPKAKVFKEKVRAKKSGLNLLNP
jgi:hypothetical protein